jgi:hypothetical protein
MDTFVKKIVDYITEQQLDYKDLSIVVPSERMIAYIHAQLFEASGKPVLAPQIISIDRWVQKLVPFAVMDKTQLILELYDVFSQNPVNNNDMGFDKFLTWGQMLLSDFDEIDRYEVNPEQLFKNLRDVKDIEQWSFNSEELSQGQLQFMAFWDKLGPYYQALSKRLEEENILTKGKAYRYLAQHIKQIFGENQQSKLIFAGFNAMSASELSIFKQLHKLGRAHVLMDSDAYYFEDKIHEAGRFHRDLCTTLEVKTLPFIENRLMQKSLSIQLVECSQRTTQAQVIGTELLKLNQNELNQTLLLLADEGLLNSMVQNLPAQIKQANITVGLPLKQTALRSWVELLFNLQESIIRKGNAVIYHRDFTQLIHHPFVLGLLPDNDRKQLYTLENKLIAAKKFYFKRDNLSANETFTKIINALFTPWESNWNLALQQIQLLNELFDQQLRAEHELERAIIQRFSHSIVPFQNTLSKQKAPSMSLQTFKLLLNSQWATTTVAYYGNPIDGLQIMGLLETRGLDFKNIYVLGLNEGVMPPQNPINSLIPMDLRRYYGLPTPREKQGLFAHHFYRLLHGAENVFITYSSASETVGSTEPSRYIQQLELELAKENPAIQITKYYYASGNKERIEGKRVNKDQHIVDKLFSLFESGISYSFLNTFITCPLDFYYKYIVGLRDDEELEENVQSNTFGSIVHFVLEKLFADFYDKDTDRPTRLVTVNDLNQMKQQVVPLLEKGFSEQFSEDASTWKTGVNHLSFEVAKKLVLKYLDKEINQLTQNPDKALFILGLEKRLEHLVSFPLLTSNDEVSIKIKGFCDRIEQLDGKVRILDFKTGTASTSKLKLTDKFNVESIKNPDNKFLMQLMSYQYLYFQNKKVMPDVGIYSLINMKESPMFASFPDDWSSDELIQLYEKILHEILAEMVNTGMPFEHNKNSMYCKYCNN